MRLPIRCLFGLLLALLGATTAQADGEVVVASQRDGDRRITLLASPWPLRAGPAEFSVLLQDAISGQPLSGAQVEVEVEAGAETPRDTDPEPIRLSAEEGAGGNPLFYAARLELPGPGRWHLRAHAVAPGRSLRLASEIEVAPAASLLARHGLALSLPFVGISLFCLHQRLRARTSSRPASRNGPDAE